MGNIVSAKVTIKGTRPLWWHHFGPDAIPLEKKERSGVAGNDPEEWRKTALITKDGQLYLDPSYFFGCIKEGARYTKKGRGSIQTAVTATLQITSDRVLVDRFIPGFPNGHACDLATLPPPASDADAPVYLDVRSVVNPSTKGRNVRYRIATGLGWSCSFDMLWDKTIVSRGEMEAAMIDAGKLVGVGSGRKIGMGRFEILEFSVIDG